MLVAEGVLGNVDGEFEAARERHAAAGTLERVVLDERERRRSRFRTTTDAGTELGVVLGDTIPEPGDVLVDDDERLVVVEFEPVEALAVDLPGDLSAVEGVELGHAAGNSHWDLAVAGDRVLVATDDHAERRRATLEELLPPGASVTVERVAPTLFDDATPDHAHDHGPEDGLSILPGASEEGRGDDRPPGGTDGAAAGEHDDGGNGDRSDPRSTGDGGESG